MLSFSRLLNSRKTWHLLPHMVSPLILPFLSSLLMSTRLVPDLAQEYTSTVSNSAQLNSNRLQKLSNLFLIKILASHGFPLYYHNLLPRAPIIPPARGQTRVHKHRAKLHRWSIHLADGKILICSSLSKKRSGKTQFVCRETYCLSGISHLSPIHPELGNQRREKLQLKCCA